MPVLLITRLVPGRIGESECDLNFQIRSLEYDYVQAAHTIFPSRETDDREYRDLEKIQANYPKYAVDVDPFLQKKNGIIQINMIIFMKHEERS